MDFSLLNQLNPLFLQVYKRYWEQSFNPEISSSEAEKIRENLQHFAARKLALSVLQHNPNLRGTLFVVTAVHGDGVGDYFAMLKAASTLARQFPHAAIYLLYTHHQELPEVQYTDYNIDPNHVHAFKQTTLTNGILECVLEDKRNLPIKDKLLELQTERQSLQDDYDFIFAKNGYAPDSIKEMIEEIETQLLRLNEVLQVEEHAREVYELMKQADVIVHIALALNTFENPWLAPQSIYFSETGNFQGIANSLSHKWYSMGLLPLEEGIFLHKHKHSSGWKDPNFRDLFGDQPLHVGYFTRVPKQLAIFVCTLILLHRDAKHIDVVIPQLDVSQLSEIDPVWLKQHHVAKLIVIHPGTSQRQTLCHVADQGKVIRLVQAFPIPSADFQKLIHLSERIVGCTGDMSLAECLSESKVPFYEVRTHKQETWQAFKQIASYLSLNHILNYFERLEVCLSLDICKSAESFFEVLTQQDFEPQWQQLMSFIHQYYSFEQALVGSVGTFLKEHQVKSPAST